jgi:hypothetical protein
MRGAHSERANSGAVRGVRGEAGLARPAPSKLQVQLASACRRASNQGVSWSAG